MSVSWWIFGAASHSQDDNAEMTNQQTICTMAHGDSPFSLHTVRGGWVTSGVDVIEPYNCASESSLQLPTQEDEV
jgi:hypothetical protein